MTPTTDRLLRGIDQRAGLRISVASTTHMVVEAARRHGIAGVGACALGRGLTSGLLLATLTKGAERVVLQIEGDGPLRGVVVDAHAEPDAVGFARGYLRNNEGGLAPVHGRCRLADALGRNGVVNVIRDLGLKERYQGQVPLITGEVDEDVESYLRVSEQAPSALGCDVLMDGLEVIAAAGILVQALPGGDDEGIRPLQHRLRTGGIYEFLASTGGAVDPRRFAEAIYDGPIEFVNDQPLEFRCRCSESRVHEMLHVLTPVDIDEMIAERGEAEITCNFCNERYVVGRTDLERIRAELANGPRGNN